MNIFTIKQFKSDNAVFNFEYNNEFRRAQLKSFLKSKKLKLKAEIIWYNKDIFCTIRYIFKVRRSNNDLTFSVSLHVNDPS